jgi:hypothetical protein
VLPMTSTIKPFDYQYEFANGKQKALFAEVG